MDYHVNVECLPNGFCRMTWDELPGWMFDIDIPDKETALLHAPMALIGLILSRFRDN